MLLPADESKTWRGAMEAHLGIWTASSFAGLTEAHVILIAAIHLTTLHSCSVRVGASTSNTVLELHARHSLRYCDVFEVEQLQIVILFRWRKYSCPWHIFNRWTVPSLHLPYKTHPVIYRLSTHMTSFSSTATESHYSRHALPTQQTTTILHPPQRLALGLDRPIYNSSFIWHSQSCGLFMQLLPTSQGKAACCTL